MVDMKKATGKDLYWVDTKSIKDTTIPVGIPHLEPSNGYISGPGVYIVCPMCFLKNNSDYTNCGTEEFQRHVDPKKDYAAWEGEDGMLSIKMNCYDCGEYFYICVGMHKFQSVLQFRIPKPKKPLRVKQT